MRREKGIKNFLTICNRTLPDAKIERGIMGDFITSDYKLRKGEVLKGDFSISDYKLRNGEFLDILYCPPVINSSEDVFDTKFIGALEISYGPRGRWSNDERRKYKFCRTFSQFEKELKRVLSLKRARKRKTARKDNTIRKELSRANARIKYRR